MKFFLFLLLVNVSIHAKHFKCNRNLSCGCGLKNVEINARIIQGEEAVPYSWSMMVSIRYDLFADGNFLRHVCGGTILSESYILTAATCFGQIRGHIKSANVTIATGIHRRSQPIQMVRQVDEMIVHPNWTGGWAEDFDIALLHLSEPLNFEMNSLITQTCLPSQLNDPEKLLQYPPSNTTLAVVGWGRTFIYGEDSDLLRQVIVASIDPKNTKCADHVIDLTRRFCAGVYKDSIGPCYGDFGGPIFQWMDDHWEQIGIASSTSDECKKSSIMSYTRLAYYHDWIEENIKNSNETTEETTITTSITVTTQKPVDIYECDRHTTPCGCGRRHVQISHLNNYEAVPYSWSTVVSIRLNDQHFCSGSILSESYILTSASCLTNASLFRITVVAGLHNHSEDNGISRKVDQIFYHPDYSGAADHYVNDIAILHISEELHFGDSIFLNRVCLPGRYAVLPDSIYYPTPGAHLVVTGWGLMNCNNQTEQQLLQQIQIDAVDNSDKNCIVEDQHRRNQFCAGLKEKNTEPCIRDPGSPIFEWFGDRWQQVGIASYGIDCAQFKDLGVYTRIIDYDDWIESIIQSDPIPSPTPPILTTTITTPPEIITSRIVVNFTTASVKLPEVYRCNQTLTCGCGSIPVVLTAPRIIGGEQAVQFSWPMMASLHWPVENNYMCGATILSNSYILTAAHCLFGYVTNPPRGLSVSVGTTDLKDARRIRRTADHVYIHPNYTGQEDDLSHDIALVHISPPLTMGNNLFLTKTCIHPLDSMTNNEEYIKNGTRLTTIGWGTTEYLGELQVDLLRQVEIYAIDNEDPICIHATNNDSQTQFCAGLHEGGKDACQGDSGGPIFQWTGDYWEQVGIVSHGSGCGNPNSPGVYTRLSYYYDWISDILKNDNEYLEPRFSSNETSVKPTVTATSIIGLNNTTAYPINSSETTVDEAIPTTKNNVYNYQENTLIFSVLALLFGMLLQ